MFSLGSLIFTFAMGIFAGIALLAWALPLDLDKKLKDAIDREDYKEAARIQKMINRRK